MRTVEVGLPLRGLDAPIGDLVNECIEVVDEDGVHGVTGVLGPLHDYLRPGERRARLALDSCSYLHLPMVAGIIFSALGIEQTLAHVGEPLGTIPAVALSGGVALYLLGHNGFRLREEGT